MAKENISNQNSQRVLIDCDPGIDDALAILFALGSPELEVHIITTVFGNVGLKQTTENLVKILALAGLKKLPRIGMGSGLSLTGRQHHARSVHGADGLGETNLPVPTIDLEIRDGIDLIKEAIKKSEIDTIIATGPLTNIARALEESQGLKRLPHLVIMGGALRVPGNMAGKAEFNFYNDPVAAKIVLESNFPKTLVSLDVTQKVVLKEEQLEPFRKKATPLAKFITKILEYSINFHKKTRTAEGAYLHDPLAVGVAQDESLVEVEELCVEVNAETGALNIGKGPVNVKFCKKVDSERFIKIFLNRLEDVCGL